ncbi:hypothetical protein [Paraburkholderia youngii]|uniref:hypothetical protein n=1 Tax=Paraburkholderia youngii TaxID=2782701 RepID=UPI003D2303EA
MPTNPTTRRAIENADASLHSAGLPTFTETIRALALLLENSGNVHASECALFCDPVKPCDCALGVASMALSKYRAAD